MSESAKKRMSTSDWERDKVEKLREKARKEARNVLGKRDPSPMQIKILNNITRLSEYLQSITNAALKSRDIRWQAELLRDIQQIGKMAGRIMKKLEERGKGAATP